MDEAEPKFAVPTVSGEVRACGPTETDPFDDMHDNQADWDQYVSLLPLRWCCTIGEAFDEADTDAKDFQTWHRWFTYLAAGLATATVVLAITGLGYVAAHKEPGDATHLEHDAQTLKSEQNTEEKKAEPKTPELEWEDTLDTWELGAASLTFFIVGVGFFSRVKNKWLRARHRAELFRLLRYNFLIQPSVWNGVNDQEVEQWIQKRIAEIVKLTDQDLEEALNEPSPPGPYEAVQSRLGRHRLQALTQYYLAKRLGPQKEYLANRAQRNEIKDWMRFMLPFFFFGSIVAVAAKLVLKRFQHSWGAFAFVMAATLLPVFAAGIRTYLAAFEFSRNKSRFYAAHKALSDTEKSLVQNTFMAVTAEPREQIRQESVFVGSPLGQVILVAEQSGVEAPDQDETDAYRVLRDLAWCEHVLDAEHREWLRLMYDAEWFG
jgi:hypothetical protein